MRFIRPNALVILGVLSTSAISSIEARAQMAVELDEISVGPPSALPGAGVGNGPASEFSYGGAGTSPGSGSSGNFAYTAPVSEPPSTGEPGISGAGAGGQQFGSNAPSQVRSSVIQASGNAPVVQSNGVPSMYAQMAALNGGPSLATIMANPNATLAQLSGVQGAGPAPAQAAAAPAAAAPAAPGRPPVNAAPAPSANAANSNALANYGLAAGAPATPGGMTAQQAAGLGLSAKDWGTYLRALAANGGGVGAVAPASAAVNGREPNPWAQALSNGSTSFPTPEQDRAYAAQSAASTGWIQSAANALNPYLPGISSDVRDMIQNPLSIAGRALEYSMALSGVSAGGSNFGSGAARATASEAQGAGRAAAGEAQYGSAGLWDTVTAAEVGANDTAAMAKMRDALKGVNFSGGRDNCTACAVAVDNYLTTGLRSSALDDAYMMNPKSGISRDILPGTMKNAGLDAGQYQMGLTADEVTQQLAMMGDGSRMVVGVRPGLTSGPIEQHAFNAANFGGEVVFGDGQVGVDAANGVFTNLAREYPGAVFDVTRTSFGTVGW